MLESLMSGRSDGMGRQVSLSRVDGTPAGNRHCRGGELGGQGIVGPRRTTILRHRLLELLLEIQPRQQIARLADSLYCATTVGQKIEWMRENPLVAVAVDEIHSAQQWESVIVSGRYEEFSETPETWDMRQLMWSLLQKANQLWWEPGYVETILGGAERPMVPVYFRIRIGRITGHRATKEWVQIERFPTRRARWRLSLLHS